MIKNRICLHSPTDDHDGCHRDIKILLLDDKNKEYLDDVLKTIVERNITTADGVDQKTTIRFENIAMDFYKLRYIYDSENQNIIRHFIFYTYYINIDEHKNGDLIPDSYEQYIDMD